MINFIDTNVSSVTELIAVVMSFTGVKLSEDIATNLLNAIVDATNHFQSALVNARTFEIASVCMKAGGKRFGKIVKQPDSNVVPLENQPAKQTQQGVVKQDQTKQSQAEDWLKPKIFKNPNSNI